MAIVTSAPAKVILFGEHGVNRQQPALATAVDLRVTCNARPRQEGYSFTAGERYANADQAGLLAYKQRVDELRASEDFDSIRAEAARDFFAPARYVLAHIVAEADVPGLDINWQSALPVGSGLGSGAAATAAMALAALHAAGQSPSLERIAALAWQGDSIAHGGVASGLDSGACALGGLTRYTLAEGPHALTLGTPLPLVIGDTLVQANTAEVNTRVRQWLAAQPARMHLFAEIGLLVRHALAALERGDLSELGQLMNLNELILEKIGVSCPQIECLIEAALAAGALGAKLSGSGGGGIIVALAAPGEQGEIAAAIEAAGGRAIVAQAGVEGARIEPTV